MGYAWYASTVQNSPTVALSQTPRTDLHLRAENLHAFSLVGLDPADLLCLDDVPRTNSGAFPSNKVGLVDHNRVNPTFATGNLTPSVVAVIDHHTDEGLYKDTADPRIITTGIGSCASLVARYLEERCPDKVPPELATFLLSAIVIDTSGLLPGGKAVDIDQRAAAILASRCTFSASSDTTVSTLSQPEPVPPLHTSPAIRELFDTLQAKKTSVAHLRTRDLLRRDYKEYALTPSWAPSRELLIGLASVPIGLGTWLPREGGAQFADAVRMWMNERGLTALGILTSFRSEEKKHGKGGHEKHAKNGKHGKHKREQLYVVRVPPDGRDEEELAERLFRGLEESEELGLKTKKWGKLGVEEGAGFREGWCVRVWKQKKTDATRKATAPIVKAIVEGSQKIDGTQAAL